MKEIIVPIVVPSAGRADICESHKYMANSIYCVPESEEGLYKEYLGDTEIIAHPNSVKGIADKRQWIYDKFRNVFMMDDDLTGLKKMCSRKGQSEYVSPEDGYWLVQNCANLARLAECVLFGFNCYVVPEHYTGFQPFSFSGYINGCGWGFLEGGWEKLKFNNLIKTNNDFYLSALNAHYFRKSFIDRRYCFGQDSIAKNVGGCSLLRTNETEEADYNLLRQYFGEAIHPKVIGKYMPRHKSSKTLTIPY